MHKPNKPIDDLKRQCIRSLLKEALSKVESNKPTIFLKITNETEYHHSLQYGDGVNKLSTRFHFYGSCSQGGLYFTSPEFILNFLMFGTNLRVVSVEEFKSDPNFLLQLDPGKDKWRSNMLFLKEKMELSDPLTYQFLEKCGTKIYFESNARRIVLHAASHGYLEVIKMFFENEGLGFKHRTYGSYEFLSQALIGGHLEAAKYLHQFIGLETSRLRMKFSTEYGMFFDIAESGNVQLFREFLSYGYIPHYEALVSYHKVLALKDLSMFKFLMGKIQKNKIILSNPIPFMEIIRLGSVPLIEFWKGCWNAQGFSLENTVFGNQKCSDVVDDLIVNSHRCPDPDTIKYLISTVFPSHMINPKRILDVAGNLKVLKYFIEELKIRSDMTRNKCLEKAVLNGRLDVVKYLIVDCLVPQIYGRRSNCILNLAMEKSQNQIVDFLVEHNSSLDSSYYKKLMESAITFKKMEYIVLALKNGVEFPCFSMCMSDFIRLIKRSPLPDLEFLMSIPIIKEHVEKWVSLQELYNRALLEGYEESTKFLAGLYGDIIAVL